MRSRIPVSRLTTASGTHGLHLSVAAGFLSRLRGLMLAPTLDHDAGLILTNCSCIHTCFMRQEIDVLHVDDSGTVVRCVSALPAWRISFGNGRMAGSHANRLARHVIELRAGTIMRLEIVPGSTISHPAFAAPACGRQAAAVAPAEGASESDAGTGAFRFAFSRGQPLRRIRGSAMTEFAVVAPIMTVIGLATIQYGLLFFAKNQYNHAAFMAARAGSTGNAGMAVMQQAYARALTPLYGGGMTTADLAKSYRKATDAVGENAVIEMLNPTAESFSDWNDDVLQQTKGGGVHQVIPNGGLAMKKAAIVPAASGQSIQDANLLKLRITHGYKPQVPVIGPMYTRYLKWLDPGTSAVNTGQIARGLIPVVMHVTMHMQSDAIEGASVSNPGMGNGGTPTDPGSVPQTRGNPPTCATALCTTPARPPAQGSGEPGQGGAPGEETQPGGVCTAPGAADNAGPVKTSTP